MDETPTTVENADDTTEKASVIETLPKWSGKGRPPEAIMKDIRAKKVAFFKSKKKGKEIVKMVSKLDLFLEEFIRNGGNATEAAWKIYNCKNRSVASVIGRDQLIKAKDVGRIYLESEGYSYGRLLKLAADKIETSKDPAWWDRLMKIAGYEDFMSKGKSSSGPSTTIVNVIGQAQKDLASEYIEGEEIDGDNN